jgi:hypothetical protein
LVIDRGLESAYIKSIKDVGAVAFRECVQVDFAVGGDGHVLVVFAEGAFAGGVDDVGEDDAFETIGPPDEDFPADQDNQLTVGTCL